MKRILTILTVFFAICMVSSNATAQTRCQDQSAYVYCIVDFQNTKHDNEWKVKMTIDFGQANYREREQVIDENGNDMVFNSNIAVLNWLGMQGWEFVPYPTLNDGDSRTKYYMRLNVSGLTLEEINDKLNIFYNPKNSDTTYVQNKDGLF